MSSRPEPAAAELLEPSARRFEAAVVDPQAASDVRALVEELAALGFHVLEAGTDVEPLGLRPDDVLDLRGVQSAADALADQLERRRAGELPGSSRSRAGRSRSAAPRTSRCRARS